MSVLPETFFPSMPADCVRVALHDLPRLSPWPARLLGLAPFDQKRRHPAVVEREYAQKWERLRKAFQTITADDLKGGIDALRETHFAPTLLFHKGEAIYHSPTNAAFWSFNDGFLSNVVAAFGKDTSKYVELGSGWGRNLFVFLHQGLCQEAIGGEYTEQGVLLGRNIASRYGQKATFKHFDYQNPDRAFLEQAEASLVFSHNSIEQVSHLTEIFIEALAAARPKAVIHFEPVSEYGNDSTLLQLMWKRYTQLNDYNRNLRSLLLQGQERGLLRIVAEYPHIYGLNGFNPGSLIVWKPV